MPSNSTSSSTGTDYVNGKHTPGQMFWEALALACHSLQAQGFLLHISSKAPLMIFPRQLSLRQGVKFDVVKRAQAAVWVVCQVGQI